ncbi:hypothetical protein Micbo1qcDRAFT_1190 [Microdochium bolleyi]|uniref:Uncharacterized protein n=1 Tax=Microdochium bolleyi TaxID=196109 RepID=A0A136JH73_9PEZI|nr:hypothetical protein Micbo1qcDRAFT_1190 [Microdochium bolleyi]
MQMFADIRIGPRRAFAWLCVARERPGLCLNRLWLQVCCCSRCTAFLQSIKDDAPVCDASPRGRHDERSFLCPLVLP